MFDKKNRLRRVKFIKEITYFTIKKDCLVVQPCEVRMSETMRPYKAKASPKINIKIIPTKILSCWALALTPASPTIPMAKPAALN